MATKSTLIVSTSFIVVLGTVQYLSLADPSYRSVLARIFGLPDPDAENDRLRRELAEVKQVYAEEKLEKHALNGTLKAMAGAALVLESTNKDLVKREQAAQAQATRAQQRLADGVTAAQRFGHRMNARIVAGARRQLATLPGKVVPAVGASIAVASTALELHDMCETSKDISELNLAVGLPAVSSGTVCGFRVGTVDEILRDAQRNWTSTYARAKEAVGLQ